MHAQKGWCAVFTDHGAVAKPQLVPRHVALKHPLVTPPIFIVENISISYRSVTTVVTGALSGSANRYKRFGISRILLHIAYLSLAEWAE